jgi:hypothetical protein
MRTSLFTLLVIALASSLSFQSFADGDLGQSYRDAERMPSSEKVKLAGASMSGMQDTLRFTLEELKRSYEAKDIEQTNCIKERLSTIKGLLRISEEAEINLSEAVVSGQVDDVNHEFVKITMAASRVSDLRSQVANCAKDVNDPLSSQSQSKSKPEIFDKSVQSFEPTSDESTVIVYDVIATERPEAISKSE